MDIEAGKGVESMKKLYMTGTDLEVSRLALGTAQFGSGISKESAFEQLDAYVFLGGNLIDTAHVYGDWVPGLDSPSEETVGEWLRRSGKRKEVIVSTKGGHPDMEDMSAMRVKIPELEKDLEASLRKLKVDYLDLYFLHRDDPQVPVEELLGWLEKKAEEGKIRYYGCSNWGLDRMKKAQKAAKENGYHGFACNQIMGCLADVHPETLPPSNVVMDADFRAYHQQTGLSFMAYMPLARGYFMRRLAKMPVSQESRDNYTSPSNDRIAEKLKVLAGTKYSVLDFCVQYLIQQRFPSIPVAGFRDTDQLRQTADAVECEMPPEILEQVSCLKELQK